MQPRALVAQALRKLEASDNPDLRRDGLEIMAELPGKEVADLSEVADAWLSSAGGPVDSGVPTVFRITCCLPFPSCVARLSLRSFGYRLQKWLVVAFTRDHDRPDHPGSLVGERCGRDLHLTPCHQPHAPKADVHWLSE